MILSQLLKIFFLILFATNVYAREQLVDLSEQAVPVLNDELNRMNENIDNKVRDKGDSTAVDFTQAVLTTDATWRDLNLSTKIPLGTKWVILAVELKDDAAGSYLMFRKNGYYNSNNISQLATQVANVSVYGDLMIQVDSNRIIEYKASNLAFTNINIKIKGVIK